MVASTRRMTNVAFGAPGIEPQERWEENAGYSPSTLATVIAGLVCAADFAKERAETSTSDFILSWSMPTDLELVEGLPRHYVRINPTNVELPDPVSSRRDGVCFERPPIGQIR
jgi:glucoamylase